MDTLAVALTAWIGFHASIGVDLEALLLPGTTDAELDRVETEIGFALPDDLRSLYLRADGQLDPWGNDAWPDPSLRGAAMFGHYRFRPLDEALSDYRYWLNMYRSNLGVDGQPDDWGAPEGDPVDAVYFAPGRFTFASDGNGNHLAVDPSPTRGGEIGQVIRFGADYGDVSVLASSVTQLMIDAARELDPNEAARFTYHEGSPADGDSPARPPNVEFEMDLREPVHEPYVPTAREIADNEEWSRLQDEARDAFLSWLAGRGLDDEGRRATFDTLNGIVWGYLTPPRPSEPPEEALFWSFEVYLLKIDSSLHSPHGDEEGRKAALALFHAYQLERGVWTAGQRAEADAVLAGAPRPAVTGNSDFDFELRSPDGKSYFRGRTLKRSDAQ